MKPVLQPGELDRRIAIQQRSVTRDAYGGEVVTWVTFATVWARRRDLAGRELVMAQEQQAPRTVEYAIRYRAGVSPAMRVVEGSRTSVINGVLEVGRREWMALQCTDYSGGS